jgi:glycosyltransferase 2 family protein
MKLDWRGAVGIALSAALLAWVLYQIPLHDVWTALRASNIWLFIASSFFATLCVPIRAIRWRPILDPVAPNLPYGSLWRATAIGMMVNNVVPARVGEVTRAYALTREQPKVPFSASLASLAVDRLFDALVVLILTVIPMLLPSFPKGATIGHVSAARAAVGGAVLLVALTVVLYGIVFFPSWLIGAYEAFARKVAPRLEEPGRRALTHFAAGLSVLRSPGRFARVLFWATVHWLCNGFAFWLAFLAVGIHAPFGAALFLQGVIAIGVAAPAAPGFFGVFEFFGVLGLGLFGVGRAEATAWAIGYHLLSFAPITLIGAWYFIRMGMHLKDVKAVEEPVVSAV